MIVDFDNDTITSLSSFLISLDKKLFFLTSVLSFMSSLSFRPFGVAALVSASIVFKNEPDFWFGKGFCCVTDRFILVFQPNNGLPHLHLHLSWHHIWNYFEEL